MDTSATTSATTASSTVNYARLPSSAQHESQLGNTPVDLVLAEGADPDRQDTEGLTALEWTQARGQDAVARVLSFPDATASAALIEAVEGNDGKMLKRLMIELRKSGVDGVQEMSKPGKLKGRNYTKPINDEMTPLMVAAHFGYREVLALLISAGATLDQSTHDGITALLRAADKGHTSTVKALLDAGAGAQTAS